ncbi:MAG: sensor histidine kinase [Actinomycetota bacterium]
MLALVGWIGFALTVLRARRRPTPSTESPRQSITPTIPFTEALASIAIGVVIADDDGAIVYRNGKAETPSGAMHSDLLIDEAVERHVRSALGGQMSRTLDLYGPPRRVISVQASPLATGGAVIVIEDTTEQALVDAVRTDFVANISHELKTPVGALSVLAEALSQVDDPETVQRLSSKIADEAMRVGRTIDDLLELSRIEFGGKAAMDVVDVDNVMAEAIGRTQAFAESRSILVGCDQQRESGLQILGDRRQLVSALGNLIENAVKYSEDGGRVTLSARLQGTTVEISVRDFGMGIPAKDIDRIFERFYRVDRARSRETGGTGLGLAIVRHVATNHGGRVFVESREGEGSTFTLALPDSHALRDGGER